MSSNSSKDSSEFLAYTAGFFDADGSVGIYWDKDKTCRRGGCYIMDIVITQKFWMPIFPEWKGRWQGCLSSRKRDGVWSWRTSGKNAASFLKAILPYLRRKRDQARLAITFQEEVDNWVRPGWQGRMSDEDFSLREALAKAIKELKGLGPNPPSSY